MSVIKSKRQESGMEFIYNARALQIYTIQKCASFPKRYSFYLGQPIAQMANNIHHNVKCANSIYPLADEAEIALQKLDRAEYELRRK